MGCEHKTDIKELAIFGGKPVFDHKLHVGFPNIGDRKRLNERFNDILDRRWLSNNGPYVQEFERKIADFVGVRHCIAVCNATVGLEIAIRALELHGEVIVPSMTFIATAHALQWQEIAPVFCDIEPDTFTIDPHRVEELITPKTTGIMGVHLWGIACNVNKLKEIAERKKLRLIYDAAHAFGCSTKGRMVGAFGDAEVFSFHATKFLNTFEGGAIVTNNDDLASKIRLMKNFGFAGYDNVIYIGTNGKMSEVSAAMGITNLESIGEFVNINRSNYELYSKLLGDIPGLKLRGYDDSEKNNYQYIVVEIDSAVTQVTRDQFAKILWAENVLARRYFYPGCHRMEPYRSYFPMAGKVLPVTEKAAERIMVLPTGTGITLSDIEKICGIITFVVRNGKETQDHMINPKGL